MLNKFLNRLKVSLIIALPIVGLLPLQTLGQGVSSRVEGSDHSDFLLSSADCVMTSSNSNYRLSERTESVPISRQIYTSLFALASPNQSGSSTLSCSVDPIEFGTLDLQVGVNDESIANDARMTVNIYQGSNLKYRYANVQGGTLIDALLVLDGAEVSAGRSNFAIEISNCQSRRACQLEFTKAQLLPSDGFASTSGPTVYPSAPATSSPNTVPSESTSSRQDDTSSSSRQDSSPGPGSSIQERIIDRAIDGIFDRIF